MKKDDKIKLPQYLPLIVKARLHTGGREYEKIKQELKGQGFTCNQMKSMVREGNYFDGLVLYLSKWNWDNQLRPVIERAKQRMREGKENGSVLD